MADFITKQNSSIVSWQIEEQNHELDTRQSELDKQKKQFEAKYEYNTFLVEAQKYINRELINRLSEEENTKDIIEIALTGQSKYMHDSKFIEDLIWILDERWIICTEHKTWEWEKIGLVPPKKLSLSLNVSKFMTQTLQKWLEVLVDS